jgi:hypothetical protein
MKVHEIYTDIVIRSPREVVWDILTDFGRYPDWNPFFVQASAQFRVGGRIDVTEVLANGKRLRFGATIADIEQGKTFQWEGRFLLPVLWHGRHVFSLHECGAGETLFIHREIYAGIASPLFGLDRVAPCFEQMNRALKRRAETLSAMASSACTVVR